MPLSEYLRVGDFTDDEATNKTGRSTQDSAQIDAEYDAIKVVLDEARALFDILLRDDDKLENDILLGHEFSADAISAIRAQVGAVGALIWKGAWVTATDYEIGDLSQFNGSTYICLVDHTSTVAATDLAAGKWELFAQSGATGLPGGASTDDVLYYTGSVPAWGKVSLARTDGSIAPVANPTFTGTVTASTLTVNGTINSTDSVLLKRVRNNIYAGYGTITTALALDAVNGSVQRVDLAGNTNPFTVTLANMVDGEFLEIYFEAHPSVGRAVTWSIGTTVEIGFMPDVIAPGRNGVLTVRLVNGNKYVSFLENIG